MPSEPAYPRDMRGYGRSTRRSEMARTAPGSACSSSLNYEEGGENNILHGDPHSEAFLSDIMGATNWPGQRHWNMESIYEYGARAGFWRLWRLFTSRKVPVTVYGVATALARSPEQTAAMAEAGWEIASHGLKWIEYKDVPKDIERQHLDEAIRIHTRGDRRAAARLLSRPRLDELRRHRDGGGRLPLFVRQLCRRPALLGRGSKGAASRHSLHARGQRHALRHGAGLQHRRAVLHLSEGQLRRALPRGRRRARPR